MSEETKFLTQGKDGGVFAFHEAREGFFKQAGGGIVGLAGELGFEKLIGGVVGAVGECEGIAALAFCFAPAFAQVGEKFRGRAGWRSFGKSPRGIDAAVIVGTAHENLAPRFLMGGFHSRAGNKDLDAAGGQGTEGVAGGFSKAGMVAAVDALKMAKHENQLLQLQGRELFIRRIKRMRHGVSQRLLEEVFLQVKNIFAQGLDFAVLGFGLPPDEDVDLAFIVGETRRDFLAENHARQMGNLQAARDGIVIREGDELHAGGAQALVNLLGIGGTRRKIQTAQNPIRRTRAVAGMNV